MSTPSPGAQAIAALEIEDVFVVSIKTEVNRDFNQTDRSHGFLQAAHRYRVEDRVFFQVRVPNSDPENAFTILRYFAVAEMHFAKPGTTFAAISPDGEAPQDDRLASMEFTFAIDYRCKDRDALSPEMLGSFSKNVLFHMWPYWREVVHTECARMRIPPVTIPMMKQGHVPGTFQSVGPGDKESPPALSAK